MSMQRIDMKSVLFGFCLVITGLAAFGSAMYWAVYWLVPGAPAWAGPLVLTMAFFIMLVAMLLKFRDHEQTDEGQASLLEAQIEAICDQAAAMPSQMEITHVTVPGSQVDAWVRARLPEPWNASRLNKLEIAGVFVTGRR